MGRLSLLVTVGLLGLAFGTGAVASSKAVIGRVEKMSLPRHSVAFEARIDTGAHTCSMHVMNYKVSEFNKVKYIEFDTEDQRGNRYHIKTQLHKESIVRNTSGESERRYVIREEVQLGNIIKAVDINLSDRSDLTYNFLIGRNFLRGNFLVDVSLSHVLGD